MTTQPTTTAADEPAAPDVPMLRIPRSAHPEPTSPRVRSLRLPWWGMALALVGLVVVMFVGAQALGLMQTTGKGGGGTEQKVGPTGTDPAEIKGWMTLQQVLDAYPVSKDALYAEFGIPAGTPTDLALGRYKEEIEGVALEVPALRAWISEQLAATAP